MSVATAVPEAPAAPAARSPRPHRRTLVVYGLRLAVLVAFLGGWQLLTATKVLDPFFWGQPTKVAAQLVEWIRHGTPLGPLWTQVWVTMKEALIGFGGGLRYVTLKGRRGGSAVAAAAVNALGGKGSSSLALPRLR